MRKLVEWCSLVGAVTICMVGIVMVVFGGQPADQEKQPSQAVAKEIVSDEPWRQFLGGYETFEVAGEYPVTENVTGPVLYWTYPGQKLQLLGLAQNEAGLWLEVSRGSVLELGYLKCTRPYSLLPKACEVLHDLTP